MRLVRHLLPSDRREATVADLMLAATRVGLHASAYRARDLSDCRQLNLPAVIHLDGGHFIVLVRFKEDEAEAVDPALGKVRIGSSVRERFSGVVLGFRSAPGRPAAARSGRLAMWFDDVATPVFLWLWQLGARGSRQ